MVESTHLTVTTNREEELRAFFEPLGEIKDLWLCDEPEGTVG